MKINLSRPAYLAAVAYLIMAIIILLPFNINSAMGSEESDVTTSYKLTQRLHMLSLLIIPIGLSVYSINCYVVGKCVTWGYINAILIVIWVLLFVLASVISSQSQASIAEDFIRKI